MAIIPVGFGQANLIFSGTAYPTGAQVTWGFENAGPQSASECADDFISAWDGDLREITPTAVTLSSVLVKLGPNDTGAQAEVAVGNAGTGSTADVQPNMALLVQKRTALGGRRNRGRIYYPIGEDGVSGGGDIPGGILAVQQTQFNNFFASLATLTVPLVILHSSGAPAPEPVTGLFPQPVAATQRRRLRR